jgi:hypothetical protein
MLVLSIGLILTDWRTTQDKHGEPDAQRTMRIAVNGETLRNARSVMCRPTRS